MEDKKVQNAPEKPATDNAANAEQKQPAKPSKLLYTDWLKDQNGVFLSGDIYVLPHIKIERNEFYTNAGDLLYGYYIPVKYHGEVVEVRLSTPTEYNVSTRKSVIDRYGYKFLDALFKDCSQCNLGLQFVYYPDSNRLRSINYFMCGYDEFGNLDYQPLDIDRSSSESVLRSAIYRLKTAYDLKLPEF